MTFFEAGTCKIAFLRNYLLKQVLPSEVIYHCQSSYITVATVMGWEATQLFKSDVFL